MRSGEARGHDAELVLRVVRRVQRASVRGVMAALEALTSEVQQLAGAGSRASCIGTERHDLFVGDPIPDDMRDRARRLAWDTQVTRPSGEALAWVPVFAHLAGSDDHGPRFPVAVMVIESPPREVLSPVLRANLESIAALVGDMLLLAHDSVGSDSLHGVMSGPSFRQLLRRWLELARHQGVPLSLLAVAVNGLDDINEQLGFEAGDGARDEAFALLRRALPETPLSSLGGAVTAVLMPGVTGEEARREGERLLAAFHAGIAARYPGKVSLSIGLVACGRDEAPPDLLRAARVALLTARKQRQPLVQWSAELASNEADPLPDIDSASGAEYQRILAIWRLFEALCNGAQLEQLVETTLRAIMPLFRADRAALWQVVDNEWVRKTSIERGAASGTGSKPPPMTAEIRALIQTAATNSEISVKRDARGAHVLAIALRRDRDVTGVLEVAHDRGTLRAESSDLAFLRTFAQQIGRVLGEVQVIAQARRHQREVADRLRSQSIEVRRLVRASSGLVASHPSMRNVLQMVERSRSSNVPVMITGETGTGKEAVARMVHRLSNRRGPFIVVDCGAIPGQLLESELFGHEKGSFTGAETRKIGQFEQGDQGTVFLDEIGELPLELQPKLLRVLQESTVRRVGGRETISVDFRLVAATHRNLEEMVEAGTFRQDLYFRLRVLEIELPPLRERGDDILLLALSSVRQYCLDIGREMMTIAPDAEELMRTYPWPGNVRELQNVLRRAVLIAPGHELTAADLQIELPNAGAARTRPRDANRPIEPVTATAAPPVEPLAEAVAKWFWQVWGTQPGAPPQDTIESFLLRTCLRVAQGSMTEAAKMLDMHPETFASHLKELGDPEKSRTVRQDPLAAILERAVIDEPRGVLDRITRALLTELLVYCRGNKSEMARHLGWGRQTLARQLQRLGVVVGARSHAKP